FSRDWSSDVCSSDLPLPQLFDYALPDAVRADPGLVGRPVRVPLGNGEKVGVVAGLGGPADGADLRTGELRKVSELLDDAPLLDGELLASLRWLARYLHAPLGEVLATALPAALRRGKPVPAANARPRRRRGAAPVEPVE